MGSGSAGCFSGAGGSEGMVGDLRGKTKMRRMTRVAMMRARMLAVMMRGSLCARAQANMRSRRGFCIFMLDSF